MFRQKEASTSFFRISVLVLGICSTLLSLATSSNTVYGLWVLAGDLGYVVVFPQFLASVYFPEYVNKSGSVAAVLISLLLRLIIGEELVGLPAVLTIKDIPVKTTLMLVSLISLFTMSKLTSRLSGVE